MCESTIQERSFDTGFGSAGDGERDVCFGLDFSLSCSPSQHLTI
jgi:hypothetical protein